jgi:hypothetical protein
VIQWATGSVGREALRAILMHPALELGRTCGIALPAAGGVDQDMARIYRVEDEGRR